MIAIARVRVIIAGAEAGKNVELAVDDAGDPPAVSFGGVGLACQGVGRGIVGQKASVDVPGASAVGLPA